jgi:hypothetical protein
LDGRHPPSLEDDEPDLVTIKHSIWDGGLDCDITSFAGGAEAFGYLSDFSSRVPDLMILDFNIPRAEGAAA